MTVLYLVEELPTLFARNTNCAPFRSAEAACRFLQYCLGGLDYNDVIGAFRVQRWDFELPDDNEVYETADQNETADTKDIIWLLHERGVRWGA